MLPRKRKKIKRLMIVGVITFTFFLAFIKIDNAIRPVLFAACNTEARVMAITAINDVVKKELSKSVNYSDLVNIKTDNNGEITAIEVNTVEMNKFGANVALNVQNTLFTEGDRGISLPLGVVTGSTLLSYYGPRVDIKVRPIGAITTDFSSELQSAGINHARYKVYIKVNTDLQIIIPFGKDKINVVSSIPVAETLIVGKVPNTYWDAKLKDLNIPNIVPVPNK